MLQIGCGATVGGVAGGLIGLGVPEYEAKTYDASVKAGKTLVAVHCFDSNQAAQVLEILTKAGANGQHQNSQSNDNYRPSQYTNCLTRTLYGK